MKFCPSCFVAKSRPILSRISCFAVCCLFLDTCSLNLEKKKNSLEKIQSKILFSCSGNMIFKIIKYFLTQSVIKIKNC